MQDIAQASDSEIHIAGYRQSYFPSPGCTLEYLEFRHGSHHSRFVTIEKLVIKGSYAGILRHHIPLINAAGVHVFIPQPGRSEPFHTQDSKTVVEQMVAHGLVVDFASSKPQEPPLRFEVHDAVLHDVRSGGALQYDLKFRNPTPPGEIAVRGTFGPWPPGHPDDIPISGEYVFDRANLAVYGGIGGLLSSKGKFDGVMKHIHVAGTTDIPDFNVKMSSHSVHLVTNFGACVDAMHGDTFLNRVEAHFGRTTVIADGRVAGVQGRKGKFTNLTLRTQGGRIEDILQLFIQSPKAPMSGPVALRAQVEIPPGDEPFLTKVNLHGAFGIDRGSFSNAETQGNVDKLSAGARGQDKEDPERVMTDLAGEASVAGRLARFSDFSFSVPGARARMEGTYDLLSHRVNLHGNLRVATEISNTTSGMKSLLLKVMSPFFKRKGKSEIVPVHILGTYEKPQFGMDVRRPRSGVTSKQRSRPRH